jgi:hypothetical protein
MIRLQVEKTYDNDQLPAPTPEPNLLANPLGMGLR